MIKERRRQKDRPAVIADFPALQQHNQKSRSTSGRTYNLRREESESERGREREQGERKRAPVTSDTQSECSRSKMAEVSGLRSSNHFDSSRQRRVADEGTTNFYCVVPRWWMWT